MSLLTFAGGTTFRCVTYEKHTPAERRTSHMPVLGLPRADKRTVNSFVGAWNGAVRRESGAREHAVCTRSEHQDIEQLHCYATGVAAAMSGSSFASSLVRKSRGAAARKVIGEAHAGSHFSGAVHHAPSKEEHAPASPVRTEFVFTDGTPRTRVHLAGDWMGWEHLEMVPEKRECLHRAVLLYRVFPPAGTERLASIRPCVCSWHLLY
jgi:hypothetical protein